MQQLQASLTICQTVNLLFRVICDSVRHLDPVMWGHVLKRVACFVCGLSLPVFSTATLFFTLWKTDARPILQNKWNEQWGTEAGAILMLMMITMIIMITREKLVSIIAICSYNLSFLARPRPAEPCPLCSAEHNTICYRLYCKMCYGDMPIAPSAQWLFPALHLKARRSLLRHLSDVSLIWNLSTGKKAKFCTCVLFL